MDHCLRFIVPGEAGDERRRTPVETNRSRLILGLCIAAGACLLSLYAPLAYSQSGGGWTARLISFEGTVEFRRATETEWSTAAIDQEFESGDSVRVLAFSRAAIALPDQTVLRLRQNTTITFFAPRPAGAERRRSLLRILSGIVHVITRNPEAIEIDTPYANAGIEGTEFLVEVGDNQTTITVFEGAVGVTNAVGEANVVSGQSVTARAGQSPVARVAVRPEDAVQWTLYYAPLIADPLPAADARPDAAQAADPSFYIGRAAQRLAVGAVEEALADIQQALTIDPSSADALALQSIIAVTRNEQTAALALANRAVSADPDSAAALMARSYAEQSLFDVSGALATLQTAVGRQPSNALAWARLSELWLAVGDLNESLEAADTAVSIDPDVARTQTVRGFALLTQIRIGEALAAFDRAITLDPAAPMPRLGRGLALIRSGELEKGREEIEIAVILDPGNSLIRSYMGKTYYEEKRDRLAASQYDIAKELDPLDPTPWFYDAIRKQTINRPVEALRDVRESIALNENRAVFRSQLKLDQDLAARSASLGRIYRDLGFEQLALVEGWKSINADPSDFSGHRFLADTYSVLPRHEIARVSELLQSQLLQPLNMTAIQPQLAETNLFILSGAGPSDAAFNEFNPLFTRDRIGLQFNAVVGENGTRGNDLDFSGISGRFSYSLGQFHYQTDGFRDNNDQERNIYSAFVQAALSPKTSVQAELRSSHAENGDLNLLFDPALFSPARRQREDVDTARIGVRHSFRPGSKLLASIQAGRAERDTFEEFAVAPGLDGSLTFVEEKDSQILEVQHLFTAPGFRLVSGGGYFNADQSETSTFVIGVPFPPNVVPNDVGQANLYAYSLFDVTREIVLTVGLSADFLDGEVLGRDQINPKVGVMWNPNDRTTFRAAAFRTLQRGLVSGQTLEPTQVAGFNQFFDGFDGEEVWRFGIAIDQQFNQNLFGGLEWSKRDLTVPIVTILPDPDPPLVNQSDRDEHLGRAYLYWAPQPWLATSAELLIERFDRGMGTGEEDFSELNTTRLPLQIALIRPSSWTFRFKATYVDQDGVFGEPPAVPGEDQFWVTDASISYRLSRRRGLVTLQASNLFNETFQFQDTDPKFPEIQPARLVVLRLNLSF